MQIPNAVIYTALGVLIAWTGTLSVLFYRLHTHYTQLVGTEKEANLKSVLTRILTGGKKRTKDISDLNKRYDNLVRDVSYHVQKVGFVRFNPFNETGGDHSFSVALLDGHGTGFVMTGLHARDKTRVYVKEIKLGKSDVELSKEEEKALKVAQK